MKTIKILFAAAALIFAATELSAQSGLEAGYLNGSYTQKIDGTKQEGNGALNGFYVGYSYDINLVKGLSVRPGVYYSFGTNSSSTEETSSVMTLTRKTTEHNINVPVDLKYTFTILPSLKLSVFAGPTFLLGCGAAETYKINTSILSQERESKLKYDYYTGKIDGDMDESLQNTINDYLPDSNMSRFDVLVGGGIGIDLFDFITVKGGYDYGLLNRYKGEADNVTLHRSQFYVGVSFNF